MPRWTTQHHGAGAPMVLLLISFLLLSYQSLSKQTPEPSVFARGVLYVVHLPQRGLVAGTRTVRDAWRHYIGLVGVEEENERLRAEARELMLAAQGTEEIKSENARFRDLLGLTHRIELPTIAALVTAEVREAGQHVVTLNRGPGDNVMPDFVVIVPSGVVGRVLRGTGLAPDSSQVMVITDTRSAVDAVVVRSRARGILHGTGVENTKRACTLDFIHRREDVVVGDLVITSGRGEVFPKGLALGRVSHVGPVEERLEQEVYVEPVADLAHLEEVLVIDTRRRAAGPSQEVAHAD